MPTNPTEYTRAYYAKHKEHLAKLQNTPVRCEVCDCQVGRKHRKRHQTSKKHIRNLLKQSIDGGMDEITLPSLSEDIHADVRKFVIKYVKETYGGVQEEKEIKKGDEEPSQ